MPPYLLQELVAYACLRGPFLRILQDKARVLLYSYAVLCPVLQDERCSPDPFIKYFTSIVKYAWNLPRGNLWWERFYGVFSLSCGFPLLQFTVSEKNVLRVDNNSIEEQLRSIKYVGCFVSFVKLSQTGFKIYDQNTNWKSFVWFTQNLSKHNNCMGSPKMRIIMFSK